MSESVPGAATRRRHLLVVTVALSLLGLACGDGGTPPVGDGGPVGADLQHADAAADAASGDLPPDGAQDDLPQVDLGTDGGLVDAAMLDAPVPDAAHPDGSSGDAGQSDLAAADSLGPPDSQAPLLDASPVDAVGVVDAAAVIGSFVPLQGGTFTMGSPTTETCRYIDEDLHLVTLKNGFEMQATEVTQGEFWQLMAYNPSYFGPVGQGSDCGASCPVELVTWDEAAGYCNALSTAAGYTPCYDCVLTGPAVYCKMSLAFADGKIYDCPGYRLPTEAEWEYAYRAGTQTPLYNGTPASCTSDPKADAIGWYSANSGGTTHPVAQKAPNGWGLYGMAGNVREWCHDWYKKNLGPLPVTNPWGPIYSGNRVVRGGNWTHNVTPMRGAARSAGTPTMRSKLIGFRCVRTLKP